MFTSLQQKKDVYESLLQSISKRISELTDLITGDLQKVTLLFTGTKRGNGIAYRINSLNKVITITDVTNFSALKDFLIEYKRIIIIERNIIENELKEISQDIQRQAV